MDTTNISESKVKSLIQIAVQTHQSDDKDKAKSLDKIEVAEILELADQQQRDNSLLEAEHLYSQVLQKQPDNPEALYGLGMLAQQMGQPQTAEKLLSAASQVQPDSVKTWFSLGNLHLVQEQFSEAEKAYRQALVLLPNSLPIYNNLGYTLQQQGLFEEAIHYYQKALELKPDFIEAEANLGNALHAQGKLSSNQQMYYAQLNNQLGVVQKKAGDLKNAVTCHKQAIALQPDFLEAHYNLGLALQEQEEFEEAIASYQKLLELNPNYGEVYLNLGKIYQQQNNLIEAISAYQQGLKLINLHYAKAFAATQENEDEISATPLLPQGEVQIGEYYFPLIPPVSETEDKRPFWSVVIPAYQRPDYLLESLVSVLAQWSGIEEMEILVIDDASTPPLYQLVNAIGRGIVRYYRNPQNLRQQGTWNAGVTNSRGLWIHLLHDDDYVLPGFYTRLKQGLEGCPDSVGAAFTGYENINETGEITFRQQLYGTDKGIVSDLLLYVGVANPLNPPAVVIRRTTYERLGGYHPELTSTLDWELYKRIATFYDWWYEPEILVHYRVHSQSMRTELSLSGDRVASIRRSIEISESYLPADLCAGITAQSRKHYFISCLADTEVPLKAGHLTGAFRTLEEILKIDQSAESLAQLFAWLRTDIATPLRDEIAFRLISLPLNN
ncbi:MULTISPECIES: tetratricopeptide repeat protein [unclassified Nostoc]|uniref:tetratricopeptide repeat protein n=1 Tax=unclassified Nostoc TaxID=2593658 RepID=UPI001DBDB0BA|nr:tetratricopeptide repeat protein [Nostoc sp. JL23]MBN3877463.1 tetratricopeptide repeat protein [Nostoc sp. JL23]